jgi:NADPH-dependent 7-cyano-7-deazaguanine reductase QueF-like protein
MMRLWGRKSSINVQKVLWCLAELGLKEGQALPFVGVDIWNAFELSWLNQKGKPQIEYIDRVIKEKEEAGRKPKYLNNLKKEYTKLLKYFGEDKKVADIETEDIRKYIRKIGKSLSNVSKVNIIRNLCKKYINL